MLKAYECINPHGELRDDLRIGQVVAAVINMLRDSSKSPAVTPAEVMPYLREALEREGGGGGKNGQSVEQMKQQFRMVAGSAQVKDPTLLAGAKPENKRRNRRKP